MPQCNERNAIPETTVASKEARQRGGSETNMEDEPPPTRV
jgi:hypothetical protein